MNNLEDQIYYWFLKRVGNATSNRVLTSKIVARLCNDINGDPLEIRKAMERLRRDGKLMFTASSNGEPVSSYITVSRPLEPVSPHAELWGSTLDNSALNSADKAALEPLQVHLDGFSGDDMISLLAGLQDLRRNQANHKGEYNFTVSAKYLLGSSKLLSKFEDRRLKSFGIDIDMFQDRPPYVILGGKGEQPEAVILVENPISFEIAILSEAATRCAFICTFGFGLSNHGNEFGYQLAGTVEAGNAIILRRTEGTFSDFQSFLQHENCHFWGDLDSAGLHIFMRMKRKLPQLQLSALYQPMISALDHPHKNHPYIASTGKAGQMPFLGDDLIACELGALCRERSVCQEAVSAIEIESLAGKALAI